MKVLRLVSLVLWLCGTSFAQTVHTNGVTRFGSVQVGSPSPTMLATFKFDTAGKPSGWGVYTQGAKGLDFVEDPGSTTCSTSVSYQPGDSCSVAVHFNPLYPGVRLGAVQLRDAAGNAIANAPLRGLGVGPQAIFPSNNTPIKLKSAIGYVTAFTMDAAGNMFIADWNSGNIQEIVADNGQLSAASAVVTVATGFKSPSHFITDMKVDGAGNLYLADAYNGVEAILALDGQVSTSSRVVTLGSGIYYAQQMVLDGNGNIFVVDSNAHAIKEIVAINGQPNPTGSTVIAVPGNDVNGLTIDANNNLYFVDHDIDNATIQEIVADHGVISPTSTIRTVYGPVPNFVASNLHVDAAGEIFLMSMQGIWRFPASGGQITPGALPEYIVSPRFDGDTGYSILTDAKGNLFYAPLITHVPTSIRDIVELPFATAPARSFPLTNTPRPVATIANNGNAVLKFPVPSSGSNPSVSGPFTWDAELSTCKKNSAGAANAFSLAPGANCTVSAVLKPGTNLGLDGGISLTTDSLNASAAVYAPQTISMSIERGTTAMPIDFTTHAAGVVCQNDDVIFQGWAGNGLGGAPVSEVQVLVDGSVVGHANLRGERGDIATLLGTQYLLSGWSLRYATGSLVTGKHTVQAVVGDVGGASSTLSSRPFQVTAAAGCYAPFGSISGALSAATRSNTITPPDSLVVTGWAADANDGAPVAGGVQILVDASPVGSATLGIARPDIATQYGSQYLNSGWTYTLPATGLLDGAHTVSAIATDSLGKHTELSSWRTFFVSSTAVWGPPFGAVGKLGDSISGSATIASAGALQVTGWAADPKDGSPIVGTVQVIIDGSAVGAATLNLQRSDVAAKFGSRYQHSGFTFSMPASSLSLGTHVVQVIATDSLSKSTTLVYRSITITN